MKVTVYPTIREALALHKVLIERFGGQHGVRDLGLLQSALDRPQSGYYETLSLQAAALLQSLTQNHPFIDGNKRVAFALTAIFLRINGVKLEVDSNLGESFLIKNIIQDKADLEEISDWIEKHIRPI